MLLEDAERLTTAKRQLRKAIGSMSTGRLIITSASRLLLSKPEWAAEICWGFAEVASVSWPPLMICALSNKVGSCPKLGSYLSRDTASFAIHRPQQERIDR